MTKFGNLIDIEIPVLLEFYIDWNEASVAMHPVLKDVAAALGDKAKVIKIDVDKNPELSEAFRVKSLPTFILYKNGEMKWRQSGEQSATFLISQIQNYL